MPQFRPLRGTWISNALGLGALATEITGFSLRGAMLTNPAMARRWSTMALCGALVAFAASAPGWSQAQQSPAEARKKLEDNRRKLEDKDNARKQLAADLAALETERRKLNEQLVETAALIQKTEGRMTSLEARLGELEAQERILRGSLEQRYGSISKLLAAMQRMGRDPPPVMIARRQDALAMVRSAMLLAKAFPELRGQALAIASKLNELVRVMSDIRTEGDKLRAESQRLKDLRVRISTMMEAKRRTVTERSTELASLQQDLGRIRNEAGNLERLIEQLDRKVEQQTTLGDYERKLIEQDQAAAKAPPPTTPPKAEQAPAAPVAPNPRALDPSADKPAPKDDPSMVVLAPSGRRFASLDAGRIEPAIPFDQAKGRIALPVQGRKVMAFGDKTQYGGKSKGIVLETRHGAQVVSPADGWIVFAGEYRTFGQLLIINAGGGYHILLAGLSHIDAKVGQFVLSGEPVGLMAGVAGSGTAKSDENAPVLYVEFRQKRQPIDPDPWWSEGNRKVQG